MRSRLDAGIASPARLGCRETFRESVLGRTMAKAEATVEELVGDDPARRVAPAGDAAPLRVAGSESA